MAALGNMHGQKSNTRRDKISMVSFLVIENGQYIPSHDNRVRLKSGTPNGVKQCQLGILLIFWVTVNQNKKKYCMISYPPLG